MVSPIYPVNYWNCFDTIIISAIPHVEYTEQNKVLEDFEHIMKRTAETRLIND